MEKPIMNPPPGDRMLRFIGDRVRFTLRPPNGLPPGGRAFLRTNLGKAARLRQEVIATHAGKDPFSIAFWRDVPLEPQSDGQWGIEMPLLDTGFYRAKAYWLDSQGGQYWPDGPDMGISVHPNAFRSANTVYCAFPRMFGNSRAAHKTINEKQETEFQRMEALGYTVIPPSGKLRDVTRQLDHIIDELGCRIVHLLPVNPTPTTFAKMGRYGSPYACEDLIAIDPALVEFDRRATGVEQFCELARETHQRGGFLILDVVINHTGWGSRLQEMHPEWFLRNSDGTFASPGAWGTTWEDLVELCPEYVELWEELANAFLTWCRRGVDGFRCDAGYKVPVQVWQYIEARVRQEFPDALFLLEGLGGALEATEALLTEGGMQWAYSELFQNYSGSEVAHYLDYSIRQSERVGVYVHYSETHDNNRLAASGRAWSLMRNRLCALSSVCGGYGFTCGVEWLAAEKIDVHSCRGLSWGAEDNIIPELARLNQLLAQHPCFFDGAKLTRLSPVDSPVYVLKRDSAEGRDSLLILVNTDTTLFQVALVDKDVYTSMGNPRIELLDQAPPEIEGKGGMIQFILPPTGAYCLAATANPRGLSGEEYRTRRAQAAWGMAALGKVLLPEQIGPCDWQILAHRVASDPWNFLSCTGHVEPNHTKASLIAALDAAQGLYPKVVPWTIRDSRKITMVPPEHWILISDPEPFQATLHFENGTSEHARSIRVNSGHVAFFSPRKTRLEARLELYHQTADSQCIRAEIRFLSSEPGISSSLSKPPADSIVLLTNGRGGMARLCVDLGRIRSKYDCALGANLHPECPVDRHVFAKRIRVWVNADGFITPLNAQNLISFHPGPPAIWQFSVEAGDGRTVAIELQADMLEGSNTTMFQFSRANAASPTELPSKFEVHLIVRVDIEDRNFHSETHRNDGADYHFSSHSQPLNSETGFIFTPAQDRQFLAVCNAGYYHHEAEWSQGIAHPVEQSRSQCPDGDAYSPGWFEIPMKRGNSILLALSAERTLPSFEVMKEAFARRLTENKLAIKRAKLFDPLGRQLVLATKSFIARRGTGNTIIAGYPWFLDWGRDTFISARGLIAAGMVSEVVDLLLVFGRFQERGTMPNSINGNDASNRDTSDAPLWYGIVCEEAAPKMATNLYDAPVGTQGWTILTVLREIALGYIHGTSNGIRMDPESALIWSPSHFTWMDTNYPACTPREGYPIEIQVLWIRLLRQLERLKAPDGGIGWQKLAAQAEASLHKYFWLEKEGYISDLLIAKPGQSAAEAVVDTALRSNFLLAIAFRFFTGGQARQAIEAARRYLIVPGAVRSLAPLPVSPPLEIRAGDGRIQNKLTEPYRGRYEGDEDTQRKPAYHNGTAWTWTLPIFCEALIEAWDSNPSAVAAAKAYLSSSDQVLMNGCLGQIPEILDGDAPHTQRGCDAQAWSATEALRVWVNLNEKYCHPLQK